MADDPHILYRDEHFLVLFKPPGLPTTSPTRSDCLVSAAHDLDGEAPRLHPVSRLDAEVSGLVTFARTRRANGKILRAREKGEYTRQYLALSAAAPDPARGRWRSPIAIDPGEPRRRIVAETGPDGEPVGKGARSAATDYQTVRRLPLAAALLLIPLTGRTHQLRVHAAGANAPLLGDRHYGGPVRVTHEDGRVTRVRRVMLHCAMVVLPAPSSGERLTVVSEPPDDMARLWRELGGDAGDLRANGDQ